MAGPFSEGPMLRSSQVRRLPGGSRTEERRRSRSCRVVVATPSGRELARFGANRAWGLREVLASMPQIDATLSVRILHGARELREDTTLADIGYVSGSTMTAIVTPAINVVSDQPLHCKQCGRASFSDLIGIRRVIPSSTCPFGACSLECVFRLAADWKQMCIAARECPFGADSWYNARGAVAAGAQMQPESRSSHTAASGEWDAARLRPPPTLRSSSPCAPCSWTPRAGGAPQA